MPSVTLTPDSPQVRRALRAPARELRLHHRATADHSHRLALLARQVAEEMGLDAIHAHETALVGAARDALSGINSLRLFGPEDSAGIVSFALEGVHPHDIGTILDEEHVAIRAGHHCAQPLMEHLGVAATARASFGVYNGRQDVEALVRGIERVTRIFG